MLCAVWIPIQSSTEPHGAVPSVNTALHRSHSTNLCYNTGNLMSSHQLVTMTNMHNIVSKYIIQRRQTNRTFPCHVWTLKPDPSPWMFFRHLGHLTADRQLNRTLTAIRQESATHLGIVMHLVFGSWVEIAFSSSSSPPPFLSFFTKLFTAFSVHLSSLSLSDFFQPSNRLTTGGGGNGNMDVIFETI